MSRFSKAEAEARGWVFAHSSAEATAVTSGTQGETRTTPASERAEKYAPSGDLINEQAESIGLLLERISAWEAQHEAKSNDLTTTPHDEDAVPKVVTPEGEVTDIPQRTVLLPGETKGDVRSVTEAEWTARSRNDAILTDAGMEFHGLSPEDTLQREPATEDPETADADPADKPEGELPSKDVDGNHTPETEAETAARLQLEAADVAAAATEVDPED